MIRPFPALTTRFCCCFLLFFLCIITETHAQFRVKSYAENATGSINDISFLDQSTGYVAFEGSVAFTQDSGSTYTNIPITYAITDFNGFSVNLLSNFRVSGVRAFSKDSLLAFGDYGAAPAILFSSNHGANWKIMYHRPITNINQYIGFTMSDMVFPGNGNIGIAVNDKDILRTTDRGQTWSLVAQLSDDIISRFTRLSFPTNSDGYALAGDLLYKTTNGGISWTQVSLPAGNTGLNFDNISFVNAAIGYVTKKNDFTIYKTTNGAASWTKMNDENRFPIEGTDMHFINDSTGLIAARKTFQVYKTTDNGKTWELCERDGNFDDQFIGMKRLFFYNNNTAWASGSKYVMLLTNNAGGKTLPKACFDVDTTNLDATRIVQLNNCAKAGYNYTWLLNGQPIATSYNASYTHDFFREIDTIQLVVVNSVGRDTLTKYQRFNLPPYRPQVGSFSPVTGSAGTAITIIGSGFTAVNSVLISGLPAASFIVATDNIVIAVVAAGASGSITVGDKYSSSTKPGFTFFNPPTGVAPVVTNIAPLSGPVGTVVTISGGHFNSTVAGNIVSFGAVNAPVISASTTQLTCNVPLGASMEPVNVYNTATALSGRSRIPFHVTFADSAAFTNGSFQLHTSIEYANNIGSSKFPVFSIGKDIDGDGKPDLVTAKKSPDSIAVYRNTSAGRFITFDRTVQTGITAGGSSKFSLEDLDGDGRADIAYAADGLFIARNLSQPGSIAFAPVEQVKTSGASSDLALGDIDGDGRNDIASAVGNSVQLTRNTSLPGYLSFAMPLQLGTVEYAFDVALADFDGDGKNDIVTHNQTAITCFRNTSTPGNISVTAAVKFSLQNSLNLQGKSMSVADYDNDGKPDVIVFDEMYFLVFRNTSTVGNISFADGLYTSLVDYFGNGWSGCVANLNGDAKPDVLTGSLLLFRNSSTQGNVSTEAGVYINPHYTSSMNTADFDLDGKMDVISTSPNYASTLIYRNRMGEPNEFGLCPLFPGDVLESSIGGSTYQWQQDTGTGFKDIADNAYLKYTNTYNLLFQNLPTYYNGYTYRCKVDNQHYTEPWKIAFPFNFVQGAGSSWENPYSWSCGVLPDKYADVVIESGTVYINSDVEVRSMYIKPGANVIVMPGKTLKVVK